MLVMCHQTRLVVELCKKGDVKSTSGDTQGGGTSEATMDVNDNVVVDDKIMVIILHDEDSQKKPRNLVREMEEDTVL